MPASTNTLDALSAVRVRPIRGTFRAARTRVTKRQQCLQAPRAVIGEQKQLSEKHQAASDETRRHLHSALVQSDAPVQAPCPVLLSAAGKARNPGGLNTVLDSYKDQPADQLLPLHGGLPHPDAFPLLGISLRLKNGQTLLIDNTELVADAQQYAIHLLGLPSLQQWTRNHVDTQHQPPGPFDVLISNGSNHAIEIITDLLLERGDSILCEEYTYFYMVDSVLPIKGYNAVPMKMDSKGICPQSLRQTLREKAATGQLPKAMYTVPCGHNPTGVVTPLARKREIYQICREYNITIIEDDAYFYLQYPTLDGEVAGLQDLVPSYLSMDADGRVVRLDSWSKVLAPGLRLGWVTAHPDVLHLMALALHASLNGPPGISQAVMIALTQQWGSTGFEEHCRHMQRFYQHRAAIMHTAALKELQGVAEWEQPSCGMFLWVRLLAGVTDVDDIAAQLVEQSVMVLPGKLSHCQGPLAAYPCPFVRLSFANASEDQIVEGIQRLGHVLREHASSTEGRTTVNTTA